MAVEVRRRWLGRQVIRRYKLRRKTKSVIIVVQEVYLRDDICCGSVLCGSCVQESPPLAADRSHYLIPDADSLLHFLEIWELPQITSVIYLASVVKEVLAQCNQRNYRRLRSLFTDRRRQSLFFDDEHFIYTWSLLDRTHRSRNAKQSEKRVEAVASWFYEHLHGSVSIIALQSQRSVSSDDESRSVADKLKDLSVSSEITNTARRLEVLDVDTYLKEFWRHDSSVAELYASLAQSLRDSEQEQKEGAESQPSLHRWKGGKGTPMYKEHLPGHVLETEVARGVLRGGVFRVNKRTPLKGHVKPSNKGDTSQLNISIPGRLLQNRALPGDIVAVRLIAPEAKRMLPDGEAFNESHDHVGNSKHDMTEDNEKTFRLADGPGDDVEDTPKDYAEEGALSIGEVVGILQRNQRDYVACLVEEEEDTLRQSSSSRWERVLCVPMDRRVPMVSIATRLADSLVGQRFIIRIDNWEQASRTPRGHFVRLLGSIGDLNAETMALLVENGINTSPFSSASMRELPEDSTDHPWVIPDEELACRRDLRHSHGACSIDPPGSKDVDDALSVRRLPNNLLEIGVHIADVSYFVQQDALLDLEARARGTTVYMVGKSWHMLPAQLSENLCSLNAGKDRLAVSVIWTVDPENGFEVLDVWFGRTIIRSRHQMFYAQAQAILDGQTLPPGWELSGHTADEVEAVASDLSILAKFAQLRRDLRVAQGALELSSSELRFETAVSKEPIAVDTKLEVPMNWIVAEMMILANSYVARKIYLAFPSKALLRMHGPPRLDNFALMLECCAARGFAVDTSSNKALAKSLDRMRESTDPIIENAFRALATRAMSEAQYCSTGEATDPSGFYHYGLALSYYTHFTSPIRRYADVIVHRMLMAACESSSGLEPADNEKPPRKDQDSLLPATEVKEITRHLNERHKASKVAQKECNELYLLMYLQKHAEAEQAVVIAIHDKGMTVFVPKYDIRALVYLQDKRGNVLLPAEDDEAMNDAEESLMMPTTETRFVWKQEGKIGISDAKSTKVLQEYKLMDTLWVQLRADGSRAHAPKLRVRLLSPTHPAVKKYLLQNANKGQRRNDLRRDAAESLHPAKNRRATSKLDKKKVINDMVQITASKTDSDSATVPRNKEKSSLNRRDLTEKGSLKRRELSINDITEVFKRYKASSVCVDVIENWSASNEFISPDEPESSRDECCVNISLAADLQLSKMDDFVGRMPSTLFMKQLAKAALPAEQLIVERMRKLWQKKLGRAAKVRAMCLWSVWRVSDQEGCQKQLQRQEKENQLRSRAKSLGTWME